MRSRGLLTEIRQADLRFTSEEIAAFLSRMVQELNLSAEEVDALATRTEGWIAGLQMATMAIQARCLSIQSVRDRPISSKQCGPLFD